MVKIDIEDVFWIIFIKFFDYYLLGFLWEEKFILINVCLWELVVFVKYLNFLVKVCSGLCV